jgi:hypothetical protein
VYTVYRGYDWIWKQATFLCDLPVEEHPEWTLRMRHLVTFVPAAPNQILRYSLRRHTGAGHGDDAAFVEELAKGDQGCERGPTAAPGVMKYAEPIQVLANEGKMRPAALQCLLSPKAAGVLAVQKVVLANRLAAEELFAAAAATGHQLVTHRLLNLAATPAAAAAHKIDMAPVIATGRHIVVAATPLTLNFAFSDIAPGGVTLGYQLAFFTLAVNLDSPRPCLDCWQWVLATGAEHLYGCIFRDFLHISVSFLLE